MAVRGAVVVGGYINGLGLVRALACRGIPIAVVCTRDYDIAHCSRRVVAVEHAEEGSDQLRQILERREPDWRGWAILPSTDGALAELDAHRAWVESRYRLIAPPPQAVKIVLDKSAMRRCAEAVGIRLPRCYGLASAVVATEILAYPVIVKPLGGNEFQRRFGAKLFSAANREELASAIARVNAAEIACQVFDQIPGPDSQIYAYCTYIDRRGESAGGVTIRKLRQSPPFFGVSRVAEIVPDIPELRDATLALTKHIGLRGMAAAEFKLDPRDGTFRFMEINGRSVIYNALLRRGGLDLAGLAWADSMDGSPLRARPNGWPGVWINLHADVFYSALRRRDDPLSWSDFVGPYTRPIVEAVWERGDSAPFFAQWGRTFRTALRGES